MTNNHHKQNQKTYIGKSRSLLTKAIFSWRLAAIILLAVILIALVVSILIKIKGPSNQDSSPNIFTVRRDDLTITVTESGSIKARNTVDIKSQVEGQTTIISIVPEGTVITEEDVKNGKVLVELDSSNLKEQLTQREIDYAAAQASYAEAKEAYDIQLKENESDITAAELEVEFALMDFQKYLGEKITQRFIEDPNLQLNSNAEITQLLEDPNLGGSASQRLKELKDAILLAEGQLEKANDVLVGTQKLYDVNYASALDLKSAQLEVERLQIQKERAEEALRLYKTYDFPKEVKKYYSDYEEAKRALERTKARARSKLAQTEAKLNSAKAQLELRKERLEKAKRQLAACTIRAPAPGLVVYSSSTDFWRRRDQPIQEGATVYERQTIIQLPNTSEMIAEISVHESSVDKVKPGQKAIITVDAFPDQKFYGQVLKVASLPDPQLGWLNPDIKVYATQVSIEGSNHSLRPGMSAKVEILVEQLNEVIVVPVQAVVNHQGKKFCYVITSNTPQPREVRTGAFNDTFVQILDGLKEGEKVLLTPPRLAELDAATQVEANTKPDE